MKRIEFKTFSITLREVLVAIAIIALLFTIGIKISDAIERSGWEQSRIYATAAQADNPETYQWLVKTNIGNLLAYGTAECMDPVLMEGLDGVYWYVKREDQEYRQHSRQVEHTTIDGKGHTYTYYTIEYYWTWDTMKSQSESAKHFTFLGLTYNTGDLGISRPAAKQIKIDDYDYHKRYVYYGSTIARTGTVFTNISEGIYNNSRFSENVTIDDFIEGHDQEGAIGKVIFWIFWIPLIFGAFGFYIYIDNDYLED